MSKALSSNDERRPTRWISLAFALALCNLHPVLRGQTPSTFGIIVDGKLTIGLLDRSPQVFERTDIARLPHKAVRVKSSGSRPSIYSGVPLKELLEHAGAVFSTQRHEANLGSVVVVESVDGPSVVFAMAELDNSLTDKRILLADGKDGKALVAPEGPFRIIVPDEKETTRWAKQVWAIYITNFSGPSKRP